ncbi:phasin family protein [Alteribacter populi]|uniref:phasin family protein n=1 Tax=Alteribacter populi TaxID=2011011 RepID=UPI000BBA9BA2|nr:hypothetical protein [Alteribacter populi]
MSDLLKKGFLLGLGAAVTSKEKAEKYFQELVVKGKVTPDEANEMIDSFVKKGAETEETWNRRTKERAQQIFKDLDLASKTELTALESRVKELEQRLADFNTGDEKETIDPAPETYTESKDKE